MTSAYLLLRVVPELTSEIVALLEEDDAVVKAAFVTGPYDVIAEVSMVDERELLEYVVTRIRHISGILQTTTCVMFHPPIERT